MPERIGHRTLTKYGCKKRSRTRERVQRYAKGTPSTTHNEAPTPGISTQRVSAAPNQQQTNRGWNAPAHTIPTKAAKVFRRPPVQVRRLAHGKSAVGGKWRQTKSGRAPADHADRGNHITSSRRKQKVQHPRKASNHES